MEHTRAFYMQRCCWTLDLIKPKMINPQPQGAKLKHFSLNPSDRDQETFLSLEEKE